MQDICVAAVNFQAAFGEVGHNLERMSAWTALLAQQHVDMICFPELAVCGYDHTAAMQTISSPIPGAITEELQKIARTYHVTLLAGMSEVTSQGKYYISHVVVTPKRFAGVYRKLHLSPSEEGIFSPGAHVPIFTAADCCFGIQLCFDAHFPEISTSQAMQGAEILFMPFASPREEPLTKRDQFLRFLPARAYDNCCYVVTCNLVGRGHRNQLFSGVGLILDPKGICITEHVSQEEGAVVATLRGETLARIKQSTMGYFLKHRRADLFRHIQLRET